MANYDHNRGMKLYRHGHHAGGKKTSTYSIWVGIIRRCLNEKNAAYPRYGGRGITVCDRWRVFTNFLEDMGERPDGLSLDRIDNSQGYYPENCRWADAKTQSRNRRTSRPVIRSDGSSFETIAEAAEKTGSTQAGIGHSCAGRQATHKGFGWRYA